MRTMKYNGFDTETVKGYARIVATPKKYWLVNSFEQAVNPLFVNSTHEGTAYFMWNINYDIRAIIKYLPEENLIELSSDENKTIYNDYEIFYIEGKICSIKYNGFDKSKLITFYDIAQFYNYQSLDSQALKYLNSSKIDNAITKNIKKHQDDWPQETMEKYYLDRFDQIGEYCRQDSLLTATLAELMGSKIEEVFNIRLRNYTSKAGISQKLSYKKGFYPQNFGENSIKYKCAQLSFRGGMFDCFQRGFFKDGITEIDISSAYPSVQAYQPHWGNGKFYNIDKQSEIKKDDYYGWFLCFFDCEHIPFDIQQNEMWQEYFRGKIIDVIALDRKKVYYPTGFRCQVLTLHEIEFLKKYGFECDILRGIVWRETKKEFKPPFGWMLPIYDLKAKYKKEFGKESIEYSLIKIALNGNYGKTVQKVGLHVMQDFRYGSYITAETRVKLISFLIDHNVFDKVILIATDGIYLDGIHKFDDLGKGLGSWDCDYYGTGLFLGNGLYQLTAYLKLPKEKQKSKLKLRGYGSGKYIFKDYDPITYDLIESVRKHKNDITFQPMHPAMHKRKPNTFKMCLHGEMQISDMNIFEERDKAISCLSDRTKHWEGINCFGDLLKGHFKGKRFTIKEIEAI